ncbi:MAG: arginine--tRNA ligase [Anaerolineae bacterium]
MKVLTTAHAELITQAIAQAQAAGDLPAFEIPEVRVQAPNNPELADYASPVAMQLARLARMAPLKIAEAIVKHLPSAEFVGHVEVAAPGFINFRLDEDWLKQQVEAIISEGEDWGQLHLMAGKRAQVEFVSANPTGPLHVGRTRGAVLGDSVARLLEAVGYDVEREYYFNNAGRQMEMLGRTLRARYLQALGQDEPLPEEGYAGEYLKEIAADLVQEVGDAWADRDWPDFKERAEAVIFGWIRNSLLRLGVKHDVFFNENSLYESGAIWETLEALRKGGYIYESPVWEGADEAEREAALAQNAANATWFRSTQFGDEKDRVLVKASGDPTYTLPDIAYHVNKLERGFDFLVNILGADHGTQYKVVQYGLQALGYDVSKLHVTIHQMVSIYKGGELIKGSTRAGDIIPIDEVIDEVGPDSVRYFLLARSPNSDVEFDLDLAVAQNNENPVYYIQNAHVRCAGIFRMAAQQEFSDEGADLSLLGEPETAFLRQALRLGETLVYALEEMAPHQLAFFALETARLFHPMYDNVRVFHSEVPEDVARARLRFYRAAKIVFQRLLTMMGMSAPEVM